MIKSDNIEELAKALTKAQSAMKGAKLDSENPFYHSKYADLTSVWDACRKPLTDNGLSVPQTMAIGAGGECIIETTLMHSSGQWITSNLQMPFETDPQKLGKEITYGRRYALSAIVGICPEDDDAESFADHTSKPSQAATSPVKPQSGTDMPNKEHWCYIHDTEFFMKGKMKGFAHPIGDTGQWCNEKNVKKEQEDIPTAFDNLESEVPMAGESDKAGAVVESIEELSNPAQRKKIFATSNAMGYTDDDVKDLMTKMFKTEHTHDLTKKQANELIEAIARGDGLK